MDAAVRLSGVTKTFGPVVAVRDLDLTVPRGGLYGVIGPNGAGKTTTIRIIMSILFADRGDVNVLGHASAVQAKDRVGYLPEERGVYRKMRVGAFLTYMGRLKGVGDSTLTSRVGQLLERFGLAGTERKRCEDLSKGMLQKVQLAAAILHHPDLLILDEPFSGLDPVSRRQLREVILEEHRRGATVLFSTHVMPHAEEICDHVVMIHRGEKVIDEPMERLRQRTDARVILFEPLDPAADVQALSAIAGVESVTQGESGCELHLRAGTDPAAVIRAVANSVPPARIELARPRLEDIFVHVVTGEAAAV